MPGPSNAFCHRVLVDAIDRLLASRVERRHDDAVGIAEARAEIVKEIAHTCIAVRLKHRDQATAGTAARSPQHSANFRRVMGIVVVDRCAIPHASQLIAPLDAGKIRQALLDRFIGNASLARNSNCCERIERIVLTGERDRPAADYPLTAAHTPAKFGVNQEAVSLVTHPMEHKVSTLRRAIREKPPPVAAQLQPFDHVAYDRVIDARYGKPIEGNVAQERLELPVHIFDRLEVIEVLGIDVGHDAYLRRQPHKRPIRLVRLHDHPPAVAESRIRVPIVDDTARDDRGIEPAVCEDVGDE